MKKQPTQSASLSMIADLSEANGVSGFEEDCLPVLRRYAEGLGELQEDCLRNLYIRRPSQADKHDKLGKQEKQDKGTRLPIVQLDAHSDEVGFMVQAIKPNGCLQFIPLGGWVDASIVAQRVRVRDSDGNYIPGVIASKPPHFMSEAERKAAPVMADMSIDIGARSREEAIADFKICIGAPVVPDVTFEYREQHDLLIGKAFDCRLGCAAMLDTLKSLKDEQLNVELVAALSSQEEVGTRGAIVTANTIKPDIAIVFEGTPADDTFNEAYARQTSLKQGPMLRHCDSRMITNPRFQRFAISIGKELGIPFQEAVRTGGSTNGASIHLSGQGVPVIVIGLPVRYIHTHHGIASLGDYKAAVQLACAIIKRLDAQTIAGF